MLLVISMSHHAWSSLYHERILRTAGYYVAANDSAKAFVQGIPDTTGTGDVQVLRNHFPEFISIPEGKFVQYAQIYDNSKVRRGLAACLCCLSSADQVARCLGSTAQTWCAVCCSAAASMSELV